MGGLFTKDIVVLDVTSRLVGAIVGIKRAQSVFGIKAEASKEHPGYENGEWFDQAETVHVVKSVISEAMRGANSRSKRLFIGVPAEFVTSVCKNVAIEFDRRRRIVDDDIDFLITKGNEFDSADYTVVNTAAVYFSIDGEDKLYTDVRGMYAESVTANVSYILAEKKYVDLFDSVADELGFTDVRYIATNWAECIALLDSTQRQDANVVIDIGYLSSSVTLSKGEGILNMTSFSMGGGHIAADIYEQLEVPFELASEAKRLVDLNLNYSDEAILVDDESNVVYAADAAEIAKIRLDVFADIIADVFKTFDRNMTSYTPVYLTGEGIASMRGAKKYLSEKLGKSIEILTPKLPGYVDVEKSSEISLLDVADTLAQDSFGSWIKRLFNGGKK